MITVAELHSIFILLVVHSACCAILVDPRRNGSHLPAVLTRETSGSPQYRGYLVYGVYLPGSGADHKIVGVVR
jgi:hypothetical protein